MIFPVTQAKLTGRYLHASPRDLILKIKQTTMNYHSASVVSKALADCIAVRVAPNMGIYFFKATRYFD